MCSTHIKAFVGLLALSTFNSPAQLFRIANLCEENSDICEYSTGCYSDHPWLTCNKGYIVFKPAGENACPPQGCPLFIWMDGTLFNPYNGFHDQYIMLEMVKKGFVAVDVTYDDSLIGYARRGKLS